MGTNASGNYQELRNRRILAQIYPIRQSDNQTNFRMLGRLYQLPSLFRRPYYASSLEPEQDPSQGQDILLSFQGWTRTHHTRAL